MKKIRIGSLYLEGEHFDIEKTPAASTVNKPGFSADVFQNRRDIKPKLNLKGKQILLKVKNFFDKRYGLEVTFVWSKFCGCTMCPCSPGYNIYTIIDEKTVNSIYDLRLKENDRWDIWAEDNKIKARSPRDAYKFSNLMNSKNVNGTNGRVQVPHHHDFNENRKFKRKNK